MQVPEAVAAMLRLNALGWGSKRITRELGCNRATVKRSAARRLGAVSIARTDRSGAYNGSLLSAGGDARTL